MPGVSFRRHKPLLLLAFLAIEGPKDRRYLAELFWPGASSPRQSLSVALSQLRQKAPAVVEADEARLWASVECDAVLLRDAAAGRDWRGVVDLYAGPFLAGVDADDGNVELEEWLFFTREMLAAQAQRGLIEVAELCLAEGDSRTAAKLAERATVVQPDLMVSDAELLTRLHALLVTTDNPRAATLRRDASEIGVSLSETADDAVRSPVSSRSAVHNLPRVVAPLVGREGELRDLQVKFEVGERLVTITGLGGVGKTVLSVALAGRLLEGTVFDQVYFVPLEAIADPQEVLARIAAALSVPVGGAGPVIALRERLAVGRSLLVLDNFEHLTAGSPQLVELLEACPNTSFVVTSREPLGLSIEALYPLGGLTLPSSATAALAGGARDDALGLFLLSARHYEPQFGFDEVNAETVLDVCRLVDGLPLGIELAAALTRVIPLEELVRELGSNLDTLISTQPNLPERHASLRAVFEHSWDLLSEAERAALAGSSVFRGGFTRRAAAFVLGMATPLLSVLLDRSLLRRDGPRYDLHPLVKQYAGEKLAELPTADEVRARHAEYYCQLLESKRSFYMRAGQDAAFEELDRDFENLRAAWVGAVEAGQHGLLERMAPMLKDYVVMRERSDVLASLMAVAWPSVDPDSLLAARILHAQARVLAITGAAEGVLLYERALVLARRHADGNEVARILMELGSAHFNHRDLESARRIWLEALPLLERYDGEQRLGGCLANLSLVTVDGAEHERLLVEAIAACRRSGNAAHLASVLHNYAVFVSTAYGDYARAVELESEAITLERDEIGRSLILANLHKYAGFNFVQLGNLVEAERHLAEVSRLLEGPETSEDADVRGRRRAKQFLLPHLHYARGEVDLARAVAESAPDNDKNCELLAWIALYDGNAGEAERYRRKLIDHPDTDIVVLRYARYDSAVSHLLSAGMAALSEAAQNAPATDKPPASSVSAVEELLAGLRIITDLTFVPLALDAFLIAYVVAPAVAGTGLLRLAATHPAGEYRTRQRASRLLGITAARDAAEGAVKVTGGSSQAMAVPLSAEAVLKLAEELASRLQPPFRGSHTSQPEP